MRAFLLPGLLLSAALAAAGTFATTAHADVAMSAVFGNGMVLQRGRPVPVFGTAKPNEKVTVTFLGQTKTARTGSKGRWRVDLDPVKAGGPHVLTVQGKNTLRFEDVLVGEVWVCSGQSNMQWPVKQSAHAAREIDAANYPRMRLLSVPRKAAEQPAATFKGAWTACSRETVGSFSAVAYYFGRRLVRELDVPIGLIHTSYGGTPAESWMTPEAIRREKALRPLLDRWAKAIDRYDARPGARNMRLQKNRPGNLWNAMIAPLVSYGMRGAIWYQGESNAGRAAQYRTLFPAMISAWRKAWGQEDFPFYFVQLANFKKQAPEPGPSAWAELREAQSLVLGSLPHTGMAVAIDIGEAGNIHPKNKQDVGARLAAWALAKDYGRKLPYSGPVLRKDKKGKKGSFALVFDHAEGGLETNDDDPVRGFAVAGRDKVFHWATAEIKGDTVTVRCPDVANPVAVRYGWADNPGCNLTNAAGLPAAPFRTDDWPLTTAGKN